MVWCARSCVRVLLCRIGRYAVVVTPMELGSNDADVWNIIMYYIYRDQSILSMIERRPNVCLLTFGEYVKFVTNEMNAQHQEIQSKYFLSISVSPTRTGIFVISGC